MKNVYFIIASIFLVSSFDLSSSNLQTEESSLEFGNYIESKADDTESGFIKVYRQTCFKSGERTDGMSKICYYRCTCGTKTLNKKSHQLCPTSASFNC